MVDIKYANAYSEVLEILKYLTQEDYEKIPKEKIEVFETNMNKDYAFNYNPDKTLQEQNVSETARTIIAILFRDYWATEEQRKRIIKVQQQEKNRIESKKQEKYNINELFKNNKKNKTQEVAMVEVKEQKWYKKVFDFFRKIFRKQVKSGDSSLNYNEEEKQNSVEDLKKVAKKECESVSALINEIMQEKFMKNKNGVDFDCDRRMSQMSTIGQLLISIN